nr:hypothetical protein [Tanacetum cinerariifolium]
MEMKDTLSACSNSEAQQIRQIQDKSKKSCMTILEFRDTLIQHLESIKKSVDERIQLKREYDSWANERQMQTTEEKVDTSKVLDASSVDTESSRTESKEHDTSSRPGNDAHDDQTEQPEFNNEGEVVQNAEECHDTWKPMSQQHRNQSIVRQLTTFKSERPRISKPRYDSQVDVHNDLSKPVTTHYLPKEKEAASAKPHHMIASSNSRISTKNMTRFSLNDMVHNHYLEEAKKRTQERSRNSEPSLIPSARLQSIANGSKPMPRRNTQTSRIWPATKNSFVTTKTVPIAEHPRNSKNDSCVTKFLKEVNSRAKVPSNKTPKRNKPIEQIGVPNKQERQIPIGHRFSIQKTSVVQKKTMTPRSFLRWKPTGKIFKTIGLRWVPTGKIFTSSTTKVDSEPLIGSNADITNQYECEQTLDVSASTLNLSADTSFNLKEEGLRVCSELGLHNHINKQSSSKLVPDVVPQADKTSTSRQVLELLFHHHLTMLRKTMINRDVYADVPSQQELDMLFGPLYDEFFNAGSNPSTNIQSTSAPLTHTNVNAEENNNDQAEEGEHIQDDEFTNPLCAPTQEVAKSSSHNTGNSNVPTFNQP